MSRFLQEVVGLSADDVRQAGTALRGEAWDGVRSATYGAEPNEWLQARTILAWAFFRWPDVPPDLNDWQRAGLDTGSILVESLRHWMRTVLPVAASHDAVNERGQETRQITGEGVRARER